MFVQAQSDYQQPLAGTTRDGEYTTGATNEVCLSIHPDLRTREEFSAITHIVGGGKKVKNPRVRQEWLVQAHHKLSTDGFVANVVTSKGMIPDVRVKVFLLSRCCDGPKGNEDMGFKDHKSLDTLSWALKNFKPIKLGRHNLSFCYSYNQDAEARDEQSAIEMAQEVDAAFYAWKKGEGTRKAYEEVAKKNGLHYSNVWATGNPDEGVTGMEHLGPHHFNVGWQHVEKIVTKLVRRKIVERMSPAQRKVLKKRQALAKDVRGSRAPKKWATVRASEKIADVSRWITHRSWYEFEGLLDEESELLWGYFWMVSMIPRMGDYDKSQMELLEAVTKRFMLQYERMFGITDCPVSYGKYLLRPQWIMKHGLPRYNDECQSDIQSKFMMDDIRRLAQVRDDLHPCRSLTHVCAEWELLQNNA